MSREFRIVKAARGMHWFRAAIGMIDKNPRGLLLTTLLFIVIWQLPNVFSASPALAAVATLVLLLISPALWGGVMQAIAQADAGRTVSPLQLFEGFHHGVLRPLLVLGLLTVLAILILGFAAQSILGAENIAILQKVAAQQLAPQDAPMEQLAPPLLRLLLLATVVLFVLFSGLLFAVPRVLFDRRPALAAFIESFAACAANVLPLAVWSIVLIAGAFALVLVLGVVLLLLGMLGKLGIALGMLVYLGMLLLALLISAAGNYLAWREVFGHADADVGAAPTTGIAV